VAALRLAAGTFGLLVMLLAAVGHAHGGTAPLLAVVSTTTYLADAKIVYGAIQNQVSTQAIVMNLFGDGSKFGKPVNNIGARGYVFLARLQPNWNLGYRVEGVTGVGTSGNQGLQQATVTLRYAYVPIAITGQAENLTKGESRAFMQAKALEAKYDMEDLTSHVNVVVAGAQPGGALATVTGAGVGTFTASNAGNLPGAIFLRINQIVDSTPVAGAASSTAGATISAINYGTRVVTLVGGSGANTPVNGDVITLTGEYPQSAITGDGYITANGLNVIVSATGLMQGLNPATGGQQSWAAYTADAGPAVISSPALQQMRQFVKNRGGVDPDVFLTGSAQINQLVNIATQTLRFDVNLARTAGQKQALNLGFAAFDYAGLMMIEDKDIQPDRVFCLATEMMKKFEALPLSLAEDEAGTWTRISGANGIADAVQGLLRWYHNIGTLQRSSTGLLFDLTVPAAFATTPPTL
jgi:hypothetical protein